MIIIGHQLSAGAMQCTRLNNCIFRSKISSPFILVRPACHPAANTTYPIRSQIGGKYACLYL